MTFEITNEYQKQLKIAWSKFIKGEHFDYSFIRPEILESWSVSRYYKVAPYDLVNERLPQEELSAVLERNSDLIEIAKPEIEKLYSVISNSNVYIILTNNEGVVIDSKGDKQNLILSGPYTRLIVGSSWNIEDAGTNSISLCLAIKKPCQVYACEHYKAHYKTHTCSGAPIFNIDGKIIGTINISGFSNMVSTHTLGAVVTTAQTIESALKLRTASLELAKMQSNLGKSFSFLDSVGLILINHENRIIYINPCALQMLDLTETEAIGQPFFKIIRIESNTHAKTKAFIHFKDNIYDMQADISITAKPNVYLHKNLSIHRINNLKGINYVTVLTLSKPQNANNTIMSDVAPKSSTGEFSTKYKFQSIIGSSSSILKTIAEAKNAANHNSNILITGESGTGKELFAQAIHSEGTRKFKPFVAINCGAIPRSLVESELFGYEQGAFTGGKKGGAPGKFELANGGTLFLDEIGDMPLDIQVSLLRVLENHEIVRLGGTKNIQLDVRIIAATNKDLFQAVQDKTFREDLYYRLNVFTIHVPPLRERKNDIIDLVHTFIDQFNTSNCKTVVGDYVFEALMNYSWPGNIRELSNAVERAMLIKEDEVIAFEHLPMKIQAEFRGRNLCQGDTGLQREDIVEGQSKDDTEKLSLISGLKQTHGNVEKTADIFNVNIRTLYRKLKKNGINPKDYR